MRTLVVVLAFLIPVSALAQNENYIVLRVNDEIATLYDYQDRLVDWVRALRRESSLSATERQSQIDEAPRAVAKELFEELMLLSRGKQLGITVGDIELQEHLERLKGRVGLGSDEELRQALAAQGLTIEQFRDSQRRNLIVQRVTGREVFSRIQVEDEELRRIYREQQERFQIPARRHLVEILVPESATATPAVLTDRAVAVRAEMSDGRDPEEIAEALGEDARFIDVGWVEKGDLSAELEEAAWSLAVGDVSAPVEARGGRHILKVVEIEEETVKPFEEVADQIRAAERTRRLDEEMGSYLSELEERSYYVANLPAEARDFRTTSGRLIPNGKSLELEAITASGDS